MVKTTYGTRIAISVALVMMFTVSAATAQEVKQPPTIQIDTPVKPGVEAVYTITVNGIDYKITKLTDTRRFHHVKYYSYEVLDSAYPLTISAETYRKHKSILKEVPDYRPDTQRHWIRHGCEQLGPPLNVLLLLIDLIF